MFVRNVFRSFSAHSMTIQKRFSQSSFNDKIPLSVIQGLLPSGLASETDLLFKENFLSRLQPIDSFKNDPEIKEICDDNIERIIFAYKNYCQTKYNRLKAIHDQEGNPATMI